LKGARVRVVPLAPEHHERLSELRREPGVLRWWQEPRDDFLADEAGVSKHAVLLDGNVIGFVQWHEETDPMYRHAGVDLFLDPAFHGQGLGTEVVRLVCAHLIDERGFHRIVIDPEAANEAAIACYRNVGFRPVGVMRRYQRDRFGEWQDGLLMDLLAEDLVRT
jgi:aminoglycoside 6'-N-acetyltransferase